MVLYHCDVTNSNYVLVIHSQLPAVRNFQTTAATRDIDSAAKFIGAGAATVGVAGSGMCTIVVFVWNK
jgi:hypothetical protein